MKRFKITVNGTDYDVVVEEVVEKGSTSQGFKGVQEVRKSSPAPAAPSPKVEASKKEAIKEPIHVPEGAATVVAPMPGTILSIMVEEGQTLQAGDTICILEAMKMQNEIKATQSGKVSKVCVTTGENVSVDTPLVIIA